MGRFALFRKKEIWTTTGFGKMVIGVIIVLLLLVYITNIHSFLAEVNPVGAKVMVLEGFVPDYVVESAFEIFKTDSYDLMIITGKKRSIGAHLDIYKNDGEYTAATLRKIGMDSLKIVVIPVDFTITKDRTFESGKAVNVFLFEHPEIKAVNLVTIGCHGRRSRYLFEMSSAPDLQVGVIAIQNKNYNAEQWWESSGGFRQVIQETIAWIYARFFFFP